jgi:hypothetical protein
VSRVALVIAALLAGGSLGFSCGPAPPVTETCIPDEPLPGGEPLDGAGITSLEIGRREGDAFVPFTDDEIATLQIGGQGSDMIVALLRVRGTDVPACLPQKTFMERLDGTLLVSEEAALPTVADGPGTWLTNAMFLVYFYERGVQVRLRTEVGDAEHAVVVWVEERGSPVDAGVDAAADAASFAP